MQITGTRASAEYWYSGKCRIPVLLQVKITGTLSSAEYWYSIHATAACVVPSPKYFGMYHRWVLAVQFCTYSPSPTDKRRLSFEPLTAHTTARNMRNHTDWFTIPFALYLQVTNGDNSVPLYCSYAAFFASADLMYCSVIIVLSVYSLFLLFSMFINNVN